MERNDIKPRPAVSLLHDSHIPYQHGGKKSEEMLQAS